MAFDVSVAARAYNVHRRVGGIWEEEVLRSPETGVGQFTSGIMDGLSIPADEKGVIGEIEIGEDSPIADALAVVIGQPIAGGSDAVIAAQTVEARPDLDLETAADAEATAGAKVGVGIVRQASTAKDNAMTARDEALVDAAVTSQDQIRPVTPKNTGYRIGTEGEFVVLVAQAPPSGAESYGMDHTGVELPIMKLTGQGMARLRELSRTGGLRGVV